MTGFPWNLIIYSFSDNVNFLSFLSVTGTYSFNLLAISFFITPAIYILRKSKKRNCSFYCFFIISYFIIYGNISYKNFFFDKQLKK